MNKLIRTVPIVLTVALLTFSAGCGGVASTKTPTFTKLAFHSNRTVDPATNLFLMNVDGSSVDPVASASGNLYSPTVSADLKTIAYTVDENIWTSKTDGSVQTELTTLGTSYSLRLSPDGKKIVFNQRDTDHYDIWIMNVDGTQALNLTSSLPAGMTNCYSASFSADSTKIVMSCEGSSLSGIFTIMPDGTGLTTVTTSGNFVDTPAFTPDGTKVLFIAFANQAGLVSVNLDGSGQTSVAPDAYEAEILNSTLYYTAYDQNLESDRIYKANLDGTGAVALTDGTTEDYLGTSTD